MQGNITTSQNALAMAISGNGLFQVSQETGSVGGATALSNKVEYSRNGDFTLDKSGYLVNGSGQALNGWIADPLTGVVNQSAVAPIKINQGAFNPVATSDVTLSANLPTTPSSTTPIASQINVYDAKGTLHNVTLTWTQNASDDWTVAISAPDAATPTVGSAEVKFGNASGNGVPAGTVGSVTPATGSVTASTYSATGTAAVSFTADFGSGPQAVSLDLGTYGQANGVTQFAGTDYTVRGLSQNGVAPGSFSNISTESSGNIVVNYDNGQSRVVAKVPLVEFANADALQREDGQAFSADADSGTALAQNAGSAGAGSIVTNSVEGSNVDIATEFTKLIVAQRAYSANTKMVTTADDMLQQTIDMKR